MCKICKIYPFYLEWERVKLTNYAYFSNADSGNEYMFKVSNRNIRKTGEMYSKLALKGLKQREGVFVYGVLF